MVDEADVEELKTALLLKPLNSMEELRDWIYLFFDLDMPVGHIYHESTSSPIEAMWTVYEAVKNNTGGEIPGYVLLSSRAGMKTISVSIVEVILMLHFKLTIAHCAAIESQSSVAVKYCSGFIAKVKPYLLNNGWEILTNNTREMILRTPKNETCYIRVIILTQKGANCVSPDTMISMGDGSYKAAKDVNIGELVKTWDYFGNRNVNVIVGDVSYTQKSSRELIFEDGSNLVVSDDHMLFTQRGWVTAAGLRLTDRFKKLNDDVFSTDYKMGPEYSVEKRDLEQLIIGTVLGDAYIGRIPSGRCRYSVFHCEAQLEYLKEIEKVFKLNNIECSVKPFRHGYILCTKTHPIFEKYRDLLYEEDGYKNPTKVLNLLTPEGWAYWFMDDVRGNGRQIGKTKDHTYQLATCGFKHEHNEIIRQYFQDKGFDNKIISITNQSKKRYEVHGFSLTASRKISNLIEPYFVNCLRYKLQNQLSIINSYRTIDQDELIKQPESVFGFQWSDNILGGSTFGRKHIARIKKYCTLKLKEIKIIGKQDLIDLHIDSFIPYLHSFYANNILVHNSSHTNILCIDGLSKVTVTGNHPLRACELYKKLDAGEDIEVLTYNHETDTFEYQKPYSWVTSNQDLYTLKTNGRGYRGRYSLDHRLYVFNKGYIPISELKKGDFLIVHDRGIKLLEEFSHLELYRKNAKAYDFNTKNHNFFVENLLSHNCLDEVDLADPVAYEEAKAIPDVFGDRLPITIQLSTRKFAFGLMEKAIQDAPIKNHKILRWNILDVTEYCPPEKCLPTLPTIERYIPIELPLAQISPEEFVQLEDSQKHNWERIDAYVGCVNCKLLSACKKILHDKSNPNNVGGLRKPIIGAINSIASVNPDMGEAQYLCHKPSTKGLIYPRFSVTDNVISTQDAWHLLSGMTNKCSFDSLIQYIRNMNFKVEAGLDWGYTNEFAITVGLLIPGKNKTIILDTFAMPDLELDDCIRIAAEMQEKYNIERFWADQAYPAYIKTFNKKGLRCPKFTKDVPLGIEAIRGKIVDSAGRRNLAILNTDNNRRLIDGFSTYHWKIDSQGNPTDKPNHTEESDIMDAIRYLMQNNSEKSTKMVFTHTGSEKTKELSNNEVVMRDKIRELTQNSRQNTENKGKKKILF